jgi:hypothetical protein
MRKILWDVLHATENGAARDFLKDSLDDHDLQLATAASTGYLMLLAPVRRILPLCPEKHELTRLLLLF